MGTLNKTKSQRTIKKSFKTSKNSSSERQLTFERIMEQGIVTGLVVLLLLCFQFTTTLSRRLDDDVDCPPGIWGCKRGFKNILTKESIKGSQKKVEEDCPPGIWGCKREIKVDEDCPPGIWGCKRNVPPVHHRSTDEDCPPGIWGCKRDSVIKIVKDEAEDCPPGIWGCKRNIGKPSHHKVKREAIPAKTQNDCPPGIWGCKKDEIEKNKMDEDCPPGIWGCKRNVIQEKQEEDENCPPGIWGCKRNRIQSDETSQLKKQVKKNDIKSEDKACPPGIWG